MLGAFLKNQTGSVAVAYGALALLLTTAVVAMFATAGLVLDHSYSAIPNDASDLLPPIDGLSGVREYLNGFGI